jgi:hypothetical protein
MTGDFSMCPQVSVAVTLPTLRALLDYHAEHASDMELADLADRAIREWLLRQRGPQGYRWKDVLLPDGSRLRISSLQRTHYATVVGDELVYEGVSMSPNQFASASLGVVRNAWEAVYVQLPGASDWVAAKRLRHAAQAQARRRANRDARAGLSGGSAENVLQSAEKC